MNTNKQIQDKIELTLKTSGFMDEVKVSPFFKDKLMHQLFEEQLEPMDYKWSWFTPKIQFATLVCVIVINVFAFIELSSESYNEDVSDFAETYGLSTGTNTSLFN